MAVAAQLEDTAFLVHHCCWIYKCGLIFVKIAMIVQVGKCSSG